MELDKLDRANSYLTEDLAIAGTSITVKDGTDFSAPMLAMIDPHDGDKREAVLITAVSGNTLTVERDMLGTTDVAHYKGALIYECGSPFVVTHEIADVSTDADDYIPIAKDCVLLRAESVLYGTIATADATITLKNASTALTNGAITIAYDGSAAGDVDTCSPTANSEFSAGDYITVDVGGESTNAISATLMLYFVTL
jgi:hypothetical protein